MRRALIVMAVLAVAAVAHADVAFDRHDVQTIFFIDKSDDHNRVDYGIHLDTSCHSASGNPMVVYWRDFETGGGRVTHGLNMFEGPVYGVGSQRVAESREDGMTMDIVIRALSSRRLSVRTARRPTGGCEAQAIMTIAGIEAVLDHVHLTLGDGPGSLRFADIYGTAVDGGAAVHEHVVH